MIYITNGKQTGFLGKDKIYIGRGNRYYKLSSSPLNNPFPINFKCSRQQSIELYRQHLWRSIKLMRDTGKVDRIMQEILGIAKQEKQKRKVVLVCWCKPLDCHGDIVIRALNWLKTQPWFMQRVDNLING